MTGQIGKKDIQKEQLLKGQARLIKSPLRPLEQGEHDEEDFLALREAYYVRPRARSKEEIDFLLRLKDYRRLGRMRKAQKKPRVPTGWRDRPGRPGDVGPGGCAWTSVGPTNINGRVTSIAIDPNNNQHIFVATVGGIWRSRDGGRRWQRVSEDFLPTVFASVAVNPGDGTEIFAGGGDPNYAFAGSAGGIGIWRSTSGGDPGSWTKVSPAELDGHVIFRIRVDPVAPHNVYAATSNGVYLGTRTSSTLTWARLGGFDASTSDLVVDFSAPTRKVYAGVRGASATYARGIWKHDGTSWQKRDSGIPAASGRTVALALAASSPTTLYAKIESSTNGRLLGVYKTKTGGETPGGGGNAWSQLAAASVMDDSAFPGGGGYSWYNSVLEVDPTNANVVYGGGMNIYRTTNGGANWDNVSGGADASFPQYVHADHHAVAFDPVNSKIVFVGDDGGIFRSTDTSAATWHWNDISHGMVITEFYRITSQQATATVIAGGSQDNGTEITFGNRTWYQFGGCDGADVAIDGQDSDTVYANCNGTLYESVNPVPGTPGGGSILAPVLPAGTAWKPPIATDPTLPGCALAAASDSSGGRIIKTTDAKNWSSASPTLPPNAEVRAFGIAPSSSFQTYYVGIAGATPLIWRTIDGGASWDTAANGLPSAMPTGVAVDWADSTRAFASFGGGSGVYITTNGGADWSGIPGSGATALPTNVVTDLTVDPFEPDTIYAATWIGVFRGTITPGSPPTAAWTPFDEGLPDGLDINEIWVNRSTGILFIGTMGHGAYERDINPGITCPAVRLVVRDNVFDRGITPSPSGIPDAEHPVPDPARAGFYKPNDDPAGEVYWWSSPDIRVDVPSQDLPQNQLTEVDHVEFESAPIEIASPPPGVMKDSNPIKGQPARAYVQVTNRGIQPGSNVRVVAMWADATSALPLLPTDFWTTTLPAGSTTCGPLDTSTGWNFVEPTNPCRTIPVVNPALPEVVGFNWSVPAGAADHSCMLAIAESVDDPIDPVVRSANERRPWILVPNNHQIGLRNLHLVTASSPRSRAGGLAGMNVPNPSRRLKHVELIISRGDLGRDARLAILLPRKVTIKAKGLKRAKARLNAEQRKTAQHLKLDATTLWSVEQSGALIENLPVPPGKTAKIGVLFRSGAKLKPGTASRFTIMARQARTLLGGSTYVLRIPASGHVHEPLERQSD
ncbi:MAG: WD40/YVTN/BNR-like repeat-containing protein [Chloroflexota bacterium]